MLDDKLTLNYSWLMSSVLRRLRHGIHMYRGHCASGGVMRLNLLGLLETSSGLLGSTSISYFLLFSTRYNMLVS